MACVCGSPDEEQRSLSRSDAPKTDFEKWMDAVRPAWRSWSRSERPACSQAQIADMMSEAWHAAANTVESLASEKQAHNFDPTRDVACMKGEYALLVKNARRFEWLRDNMKSTEADRMVTWFIQASEALSVSEAVDLAMEAANAK
jgi:hypothetical protein